MFSSFAFMLLYLLRYGAFLLSYVSNANAFPKPLSPKEEQHYLKLAYDGDEAAKDVLVEHNLRLVAHVVKKYSAAGNFDSDDLISIGTIGLIKAINSFDGNKNTRLATYAARCIEKTTLSSWLFWRLKGKDLLPLQRNGGHFINPRICI